MKFIHLVVIVPSAPTDLMVTKVLPTSISITWDDPHTRNGVITTYMVDCDSPSSSLMSSSIQRYDCQGLEPGSQYTISVTAYTGAGAGAAANVTITTPCEG